MKSSVGKELNLSYYLTLLFVYEKCQTLSGKVSWSHYCELLSIAERQACFYEREAINSNWSIRELKRQINTSLYERLLLSKSEVNYE
jgi:Uncharacterized conserved protein